jgi:hypothetical protein
MPTEKLDRWDLIQALHQLLDEELDVLFFQPDWGFSIGFRAKLASVEQVLLTPTRLGAVGRPQLVFTHVGRQQSPRLQRE